MTASIGRGGRVLLVGLVVLVALVSLLGGRHWYPHYTSNNDEPVYVLQARMLEEGRLTLPGEQATFTRPWMSGPRDGRLVMVFPWGWPAVLAVGETLTGSLAVTVALISAALLPLLYLATRELLGGGRRAARAGVFAAAAVAVAPMVTIHSWTRLSYLPALVLETAVVYLVVRAVRRGERWPAAVAGLAAGALFAMRPFDTILLALALLISWPLLTRDVGRRPLAELRRVVPWALLGSVLPLAGVAAVNTVVTGRPWVFGLEASGGDNRFGFGRRYIADGAPVVNVTPRMALGALRVNVLELPYWVTGGLFAVPLVAFGLVLVWGRRRAAAVLLGAVALVVPLAFVGYWGNLLIVNGRFDLGPHYYLLLLVPVAVCSGVALDWFWERRRALGAGVLAALVVVTLVRELPPKLRRADAVTARARADIDAVDAVVGDRRAVVLLPGSSDGWWVLHPRGYFENPPMLDAMRVYAAAPDDRWTALGGAQDPLDPGLYRFVERIPDGRSFADPAEPVVEELRTVDGGAVRISGTVRNGTANPVVSVYVAGPQGGVQCVLDRRSAFGATYRFTVEMTPTATRVLDCTDPGDNQFPAPGMVLVGASFGPTQQLGEVEQAEYRLPAAALGSGEGAGIRVLAPGDQWWTLGNPVRISRQADVRSRLELDAPVAVSGR